MSDRRRIHDIEKDRDALSLRGIERRYGYAREFVSERVRNREIPAAPRGRALVILRADFESWMRQQALGPQARAAAVADRQLEREARRAS